MSYDSQSSAEYLKENGPDGAMTDAGEKLLRERISSEFKGCNLGSCNKDHIAYYLRAELERAAEIADRLDQVEGGRIAAAIRRRKL